VLVDGDDHNEPVADAVRGILDGHIVMERSIAERGRYPAINVLKSVSRTMPRAADPEYLPVITRAKQVMATYADMEELIRLGAYRAGSSPEVDEAIRLHPSLEDFLRQGKDEAMGLAEGYQGLKQIIGTLETES
jgi:flagellum-specific ATP synthase